MPQRVVEQMGEMVARVTNRRAFLRRSIASVFGVLAAGMAWLTVSVPNVAFLDDYDLGSSGFIAEYVGAVI